MQAGIVVHSVFLRALYIAKLSEGKGIGKWGILGKHLASRSWFQSQNQAKIKFRIVFATFWSRTYTDLLKAKVKEGSEGNLLSAFNRKI